MPASKHYPLAQLRDYATLFSRSEVDRYYRGDFSSLRLKINRYEPRSLGKNETYAGILKQVYSILEKHYPSQYIYKNNLLYKWIEPKIGLHHSVVFNELRLGKAVADLAVFNGVSRVFEIKTLLDSENRLSGQLEQYRRIFDEIYLVVPLEKSESYLRKDNDTGIIAFNAAEQSYIELRRAKPNAGIDVDCLMGVLHTHEYVRVVEHFYGERPAMNDFTKFSVCHELIRQISKDQLSKCFVQLMKDRRIHNAFSKRDSYLNQVCLAMNYTKAQRNTLLNQLRTTLS